VYLANYVCFGVQSATFSAGGVAVVSSFGPPATDWRAELATYRCLVSKAWDEKTVHWRFADHRDKPSTGQCGVTSAWLMVVLQDVHDVPAVYCYGDVRAVRGSSESLLDHCWLEVGDSDDPGRIVVDLTCDQSATFGGLDVLCSSHSSIGTGYGMSYETSLRLSPEEFDKDEVQDRLGRLVTSLGPDHLPVMPERLRHFL
jgi:hypothetical protein